MLSVRVWNLQSDCKAEAVKFLENEFLRFRQLEYLAIRTAGRSALRKCHRKGVPLRGSLRKAIQHYLKQDNYIVFVIDPDSQRQQASKSLVNQLRQVVTDCNFSDKVFSFSDLQESESTVPAQWQNIVSHLRAEVESARKRFREEWNRAIAPFHNAFADIPEEEVIRHFEEALAEVRRG
ncbi:MAG: hypothetical protein OXN25_17585 [Candidatus Poribacteria bacterium]|nr:hypothetical protein [Candidatus Poribacteria bacterium]